MECGGRDAALDFSAKPRCPRRSANQKHAAGELLLESRIPAMSTVTLRRKAKALIDTLSDEQLRAASEFLAFVKTRQTDDPTLELLSIPGVEASYARGMRDIKAGRTRPWRRARSNIR
jgi:hypothetical protein